MGVIDAAVDVSTGGADVTDVFRLVVGVFNANEVKMRGLSAALRPQGQQ